MQYRLLPGDNVSLKKIFKPSSIPVNINFTSMDIVNDISLRVSMEKKGTDLIITSSCSSIVTVNQEQFDLLVINISMMWSNLFGIEAFATTVTYRLPL